MENTIFTQNSTCSAAGKFGKSQASKLDHPATHLRVNSKIKYSRSSVPEQNLGLRLQNDTTRTMNMTVYASTQPGAPGPVDPSPGHWKLWIIGTIFTMLLSFSRGKWGPWLLIEEKIETTVEKVEEVAEEVEKVAEEVIKILPEGKLHDAAELVEKVAENIDKHAQDAEDALEKVEDMEKDLESSFESTSRQGKSVAMTKGSKDQK